MSTDAALRVGLAGFGFAGKTFHAPLIAATPGLTLHAIGTSKTKDFVTDKALDSFRDAIAGAVCCPVDDMLARDDIDVVVLATPNDCHKPQALAAIANPAVKAVVVDKPFALTAGEAEEVVAAAKAAGKLLTIFHNRRWDTDFLTLKQVVDTASLGRPVELFSAFDRYRPTVRDRWREGDGPGSGLWNDLGPHLVDQAVQLFGWPTAIWADLATHRAGGKSVDCFNATLTFGGGDADSDEGDAGSGAGASAAWPTVRAHLRGSVVAADPAARYMLHCTGGSWTVDGLDAQEGVMAGGYSPARPMRPEHSDKGWAPDDRLARSKRGVGDLGDTEVVPPEELVPGTYERFYAGVRDATLALVSAAASGADAGAALAAAEAVVPVKAREGLGVQRIIDAGAVSSAERREVKLSGKF